MSLFELYEVKRLAKNGSKWKHKKEIGTTLEILDNDLPVLFFCVKYENYSKTYHYRSLQSLLKNYEPV